MKKNNNFIENNRLTIQNELDAQKSQTERNKLGQFATPTNLAREIIDFGIDLLPSKTKIWFLDPAIGTGSFYSALLSTICQERIVKAEGYEIDSHYGKPSQKLWKETNLKIHIKDFTKETPPDEKERYNFLICNPPYVRHHHLEVNEKLRLQNYAENASGIKVNGLAGLYCYFILLSHLWLSEGGIAIWLIPSEFMDVNYGKMIKHYLLNKITLLGIHRFSPQDVQFDDALVSSTVLWLKKEVPKPKHKVMFSYGGTLKEPNIAKNIDTDELRSESKWTRFPVHDKRIKSKELKISDLFYIKRGVATGDNNFFILSLDKINELNLAQSNFQPILPSPRHLNVNEVLSDNKGTPLLEKKLFLLNCNLSEAQIKESYPSLFEYLQSGKQNVADKYLCKHRSPWYKQELREPPPFVCTYLGRSDTNDKNPFRFILNHSKAIATNVYLLIYPKPFLEKILKSNKEIRTKIWIYLNSLTPQSLLDEGRVYGGGLYKLEPKELSNVKIDSLLDIIPELKNIHLTTQMELFE